MYVSIQHKLLFSSLKLFSLIRLWIQISIWTPKLLPPSTAITVESLLVFGCILESRDPTAASDLWRLKQMKSKSLKQSESLSNAPRPLFLCQTITTFRLWFKNPAETPVFEFSKFVKESKFNKKEKINLRFDLRIPIVVTHCNERHFGIRLKPCQLADNELRTWMRATWWSFRWSSYFKFWKL